jgi:hypothetical protein
MKMILVLFLLIAICPLSASAQPPIVETVRFTISCDSLWRGNINVTSLLLPVHTTYWNLGNYTGTYMFVEPVLGKDLPADCSLFVEKLTNSTLFLTAESNYRYSTDERTTNAPFGNVTLSVRVWNSNDLPDGYVYPTTPGEVLFEMLVFLVAVSIVVLYKRSKRGKGHDKEAKSPSKIKQ